MMKLFFREEGKFHFFIRSVVGFNPRDISVYERAFVHKSSVARGSKESSYNERLEFLGDAVLGAIVSDFIYKKYPEANEGYLSRLRSELVCRHRLNTLAQELGLCEYISCASSINIDNTHVPGDVVEALVAAVYLDGGFERATEFVATKIASDEQIESIFVSIDSCNYKSGLLEWGQKEKRRVEFRTDTVSLNGKTGFRSYAEVDSSVLGEGVGKTKKEAEQHAAQKALLNLGV